MSQGREWDGKERRSGAQIELSTQIKAVSKQVEEIAHTVAAMQRCFDMFRTKYEQHLKDQVEADLYWAQLRKDLVTTAIKSGVWAAMLFVGGLILYGARQKLLEWLN